MTSLADPPSKAAPAAAASAPHDPDTSAVREYCIRGVTHQGNVFRPSDWSERLAGVLSCYRPGWSADAVQSRDAMIGYSPFVRPETVNGIKCVVVDERLLDIDQRAFEFVMAFAKSNDLPVVDAGITPLP